MILMGVRHKFFSFSLAVGLVVSAVAPAAVSAELQEIEQRGKLIVAVKDNLRPLAFRNAKGNLQGLEIDIARHLAEELLGNPDAVILQPVTNLNRLNLVLEGKVDLTIARVTATPSRARLVNLSLPYYLDATGLVTKDALITRSQDVATKSIAVLKDSSTIAVIRHAFPSAKLVGADSYEQARSLLETGSADVFAADQSILTGWVQEYPEYRLLPTRLSGESLCIVMPKGLQYTSLQQRVNEVLRRWKASGWLSERIAAWGLL